VTSLHLSRLNRDITILYRHSLGDTNQGIADSVGLHNVQVSRIIRRVSKDPKYIEAVELRSKSKSWEGDRK
jgi:hypothetical protein